MEYLTLCDLGVQGTATSLGHPSRDAGGACQGMGSRAWVSWPHRNESQIPGFAMGWDLGDVV